MSTGAGVSFHDQLAATRDRKHSKNHAFFELWAQGKLTREQTAVYCAQHYHYVGEYLNWMAYEVSQIPFRDVKAYLDSKGLLTGWKPLA
jgi:pyrroloquinoline quinone (PQQ) biosynthesis protein C